jgi:hypothetical protein
MDAYERADALMSELIAAYSARAARTEDAAEMERLEGELTAVAIEQQRLTAGDVARVGEINSTFPHRIAVVRGVAGE